MMQNLFLVGFLLYSFLGFFVGFYKTHKKKNPYGHSPIFYPIGSFVWADSVVFGAFFVLASIICLFIQNLLLFILIYSLFWTMRSIGEQLYWFLEQFASTHRNPEHTLWVSKFFPRNSSWIAMQIFWQCVSVVTIISTVLTFAKLLKAIS